ncbi:MAG: hypothetical protein R2827_06420 [Bdellovibrionales bacterium]
MLDNKIWIVLVDQAEFDRPITIENAVLIENKSAHEVLDNVPVTFRQGLAVLDNDNAIYFPQIGRILNHVDEVDVKRLFLVSCKDIDLTHSIFKQNIANRLLFIKNCHSEQWTEMVKKISTGEIDQYLASNDKIQYIEFHIPSVLMSMGYKGKISRSFSEQFSWTSVKFDKDQKVFRPEAPIEGVVRFR